MDSRSRGNDRLPKAFRGSHEPESGSEPTSRADSLGEAWLAGLFVLIRQEEEKALAPFALDADKPILSQVAWGTRLKATEQERAMSLEEQGLPRAVDRK